MRGTSGRVHKWSGISYRSQLPGTAPAVDHLRDLVARLAPHAERLAQLGDAVEREGGPGRRYSLVVEVHAADINVDVEVHRDDLATLSMLGAWFAVHVWITEEVGTDDPT